MRNNKRERQGVRQGVEKRLYKECYVYINKRFRVANIER